MDDTLVGLRPTYTSKGKLLDSHAFVAHCRHVREWFEVLKNCHVQVKKDICTITGFCSLIGRIQ